MVANAGGGTGASGSFLAPQVQPNVLSLPPRWRPGSQAAAAGLTNLGNSCYLNSTLQCLAFVPPLGHLCLSHGHSSTCARTRSGAGGGGGGAGAGAGGFSFGSSATSYGGLSGGGGGGACCTFCLVERQLGAMLRAPRGGCVSPGEVVRSLHLFGRSFVKGRQEDSHEFLTALLDVMERDGRRAAVALGAPKNVRTIVEDLFVGRWQSQVRCLACGHESNTYEAFATLPLDIAQARTVVEGLRVFTEAERLDGANKYRCDRCRQLVPAVKQTSIWDDPNVLVVHIKRFDGGCLLGGKLTRHVGFTDTLDLTRFMTAGQGQQQQQGPAASSNGGGGGGGGGGASSGGNPGQQHHHHHHQEHGHHHTHHHHHHGAQQHGPHHQQHGQQSHPHQPHDPGRSVYNLTGVLVHQGSSLHSGHYYAFVRDAGDRWALMNDSAVTPLASFAEVSREQAYMLFYTRTTMKRPREPPPPAPPPPAAAAEAGVAAAGKAAAGVYGPQLPPGFARAASAPAAVAAAAAANGGGGSGSAASSAVSSGGGGAGQGLGALGSGRAVMPAAPTARLAARPSGSVAAAAAAPSTAKLPAKFTITARASLDRAPSAAAAVDSAAEAAGPGPGRGTRSAPLTPAATTSSASAAAAKAAASASEAAAADTASPAAGDGLAGRKRKRPEASSSTGAAANGTDGPGTGLTELPPGATASERRRAAVEAEVAAHKACASWGEGVKRLKGAMGGMLRRSEWAAAAAALMRSLKSSGLSLQEVVALPRSDERRRELNRVVPRGVLEHGRDELARLLRAALLQLGWLGLGASGSLLL